MNKVHGYSLWLIPSGNVYNTLANLISQLSTKYSTPNFEPHVTLIGDLDEPKKEIISKTLQLATIFKPFRITLKQVEYLDEYFKCLFVKAKETDYLMRANSKARTIFNRPYYSKYMPHLSLMYGDFTLKTKRGIVAEIGKEFNINFEVKSIHLFSTNGEPKDWHRVKEFAFK